MAKDPRIESLLKRGNYKYEYVAREDFDNIDIQASLENPARIHRHIDDLLVNKYGCAMLESAVFPAIVLLKQDRAKHIVATGVHRIKAAQDVKRDWFDAYIITEPDQYRADLLIRLLNGIEGRGDTVREQLQHALALHEKYPKHSLAELATEFNLNKMTVQNAWNERLGIQRASRLGFDFEKTQKQPQNTIVALNQIPSDLVYMKAAELVVHYELSGRDTEELIRELRSVRNKGEIAEIEVVKKTHDTLEERRRRAKVRVGPTKPTASTRLLGKCKSLNKQVRQGVEQLHLSALANYEDALAVIDDSIENLAKVKAEIERIQRLSGGGGSGFPLAASSAF